MPLSTVYVRLPLSKWSALFCCYFWGWVPLPAKNDQPEKGPPFSSAIHVSRLAGCVLDCGPHVSPRRQSRDITLPPDVGPRNPPFVEEARFQASPNLGFHDTCSGKSFAKLAFLIQVVSRRSTRLLRQFDRALRGVFQYLSVN